MKVLFTHSFLIPSLGVRARHLGHTTRRCSAKATSKGTEPSITRQLLQNNQVWCQDHCCALSLACIPICDALGKRKPICSCEDVWSIDKVCCGESFRFSFSRQGLMKRSAHEFSSQLEAPIRMGICPSISSCLTN